MTYSTDRRLARRVCAPVMTVLCSVLIWFSMVAGVFAGDTGEKAIISISDFASRDLSRWQSKEFEGTTSYTFTKDEKKGWVLKAQSNGSASGLAREIEIDLSQTPWLNWSWKVENLPQVENERTKKGDDYPARIYVIFKTGPWFWDTKALNYVWSSAIPIGQSWPNAFTSNAIMKSVQSGPGKVGQWVGEKHNVREDIAALFGTQVTTIKAIALMTDTDNSGSRATAYYGEIFFSEK